MAYIYQAEHWCDRCGQDIATRLDNQRVDDTGDPESVEPQDSDEYPQYFDETYTESDSPCHCGGHDTCLSAETLSDGRKVGALVCSGLTDEGIEYVRGVILESLNTRTGEHSNPVAELWEGEYPEARPVYRTRFVAFCGLSYVIEESEDLEDVRNVAAEVLRERYRTGHPITQLDSPGYLREWECNEPEGSALVPDTAGYLIIDVKGGA